MLNGEREAALALVRDTRQRFTDGQEGALLRRVMPPDLYDMLLAEIDDLVMILSEPDSVQGVQASPEPGHSPSKEEE